MKNKKGFTLIEMLVVISIIGILAALGTISFVSSQKQARDTQRKSDLKQYQSVLEAEANKNNGLYPSSGSITDLCTDLGIDNCMEDPKNSSDPTNYYYDYVSNGTTGFTGTKYVLWASLENSTGYWVVCSDGATGKSATSPLSLGGVCPPGLSQ